MIIFYKNYQIIIGSSLTDPKYTTSHIVVIYSFFTSLSTFYFLII
jgi:hypothetical protein